MLEERATLSILEDRRSSMIQAKQGHFPKDQQQQTSKGLCGTQNPLPQVPGGERAPLLHTPGPLGVRENRDI